MVGGRYELRAVLGRGGMGAVWLAQDDLLHREVAVKEILWPSQLEDSEREILRQRALREARMAARLSHPNIIRVFDVVEEDGSPWLVMELAPYPSLRKVIEEQGPLPPVRAAQIGLQILEAIRAAHAAGVLHRDIKPDNVLLGPEDRAILSDFGMAIADGSPTLTTSGLLIGSPSYMAPERALGKAATPAADLWSLGATLYAAVEGRPPFHRDGTIAVLTAITTAEPDLPQHAGAMWTPISSLLRKEPAERASAVEVEAMLRRAAEPDVACAMSPGPLADQSVEPSPRSMPLAAPAVAPAEPGPSGDLLPPSATARLSGPGTLHSSQPARDAGPTPPAPRQRFRLLAAAMAALVIAAVITTGIMLAISHAPPRSSAVQGRPPALRNPVSHPVSRPARDASTRPSSSPGTTASPSPSAGAGRAELPAGFVWYHDPTGFSIGMPRGWQVSHQAGLVYFVDPASNRFLFVQQTTHAKLDPLADWRQQVPYRKAHEPGFRLLRLARVRYPQAERAADMEFTFYQHGQLTHVLSRNVLVDSHQAYALYWSTPQSQWAASQHLFAGFAATFRPVRSGQAGARSG
jgi:eukaryotic-like serine/threonine-protein kinase